MTFKGGSLDDEPGEVDIPGLKEKALTPAQKRALEALKALSEFREKRKATAKQLREEEQGLLDEALGALDGLKLQAGKIGPASFEASVVRKLKLKVLRKKLADPGK